MLKRWKGSVCAVAAILLTGCEGGLDPAAFGEPAVDAASLCVSSDCGEAIPLVGIPDAENIHFSPEGRLFVSGGTNVFEITRAGELEFTATPLSLQTCNFTGLAQRDNYLYAACGDGRLFGGELTAEPVLEPIFEFEGMCLPNGAAVGPEGRLYVADSALDPTCLPPDPKIVRLDIDPQDPSLIRSQETWLQGSPVGLLAFGLDETLRFPNGLAVADRRFFGTDGGSVYAVDLLADGSPGPVMPLSFRATALDDLSLAGDSLLVSDFVGGGIFQLSLDGELMQATFPLVFASPSAVQLARPPMFRPDDILVTEKGVLGEQSLPIDQLSLFRRIE